MNQDKFKLWKLALSAIHVDGKVTAEEEKWFQETVLNLEKNKILNFSPEQMNELKQIFYTPTENLLEEFKSLSKPADCSLLVHYLRIVSHLDSDFSEEEKSLYKKLEQACLENVNFESVESKIKKLEKKNQHQSKGHNHSFFESAFRTMLEISDPSDGKHSK